jgi:hypothetical protein
VLCGPRQSAETWRNDGSRRSRLAAIDLARTGTSGDDSATAERARQSVTKSIKVALVRIETAHPDLALHLRVTIRRGQFCSYMPDPRHSIEWVE